MKARHFYIISIWIALVSCSSNSDSPANNDVTPSDVLANDIEADTQSDVETDTQEPAPDEGSSEDVQGATTDTSTPEDEGTPPPVATTYNLITLNVGLAYGYVPYAEERREQVLSAIENLDADVLCLQEVWTEDDRNAVKESLENKGYNVHVYVTSGAPASGCTEEEAQPLIECSNENSCTELPGSEFTDCVLANCGPAIGQVSQGCLGCLANDLTRSLANMIENCVGVEEVNTWSNEGHNGLVMATKDPDTEYTDHDFEASLVWRSYIKASLPSMANTLPSVDSIACTHLTSFLSNVPYIGPFSGYEEENAQQIDALLEAMPAGNNIIMGDLNTGPANEDAGISAELPNNFAKFTDAKWQTVNLETCTWCPAANNLLSDTGSIHNIDHILLSETLAAQVTTVSETIWTEEITIMDSEDNEIAASLSDHFGLHLELSPNQE